MKTTDLLCSILLVVELGGVRPKLQRKRARCRTLLSKNLTRKNEFRHRGE